MQANLIELSMYQISQLFLIPTLVLIAALFLYAFWVLGEFALLAFYRRRGKGRLLVSHFCRESTLSADALDVIAHKQLENPRIASRVTPMLGLVATMIPMGPALKSLSDGNLAQVSENLTIAFSAVILALIAASMVAVLAAFFQYTATGRALRAVADDHQAAQSIGIPLNRIWVIVWCVAGVVALVAGMIWGSKLGVQFSLTTVALRALPVVILGGLTSVPGAIIGGLIIGVGEKLSEVYLGPFVGGGIEIWFAYVLALVFLLFRPQGLFGEKIIDRV